MYYVYKLLAVLNEDRVTLIAWVGLKVRLEMSMPTTADPWI